MLTEYTFMPAVLLHNSRVYSQLSIAMMQSLGSEEVLVFSHKTHNTHK